MKCFPTFRPVDRNRKLRNFQSAHVFSRCVGVAVFFGIRESLNKLSAATQVCLCGTEKHMHRSLNLNLNLNFYVPSIPAEYKPRNSDLKASTFPMASYIGYV